MNNSRKNIFAIQFLQLIDAVLIWVSFLLAFLLRKPLIDTVNHFVSNESYKIYMQNMDGMSGMIMLIVIMMPLLPLMLEVMGFYKNPLRVKPIVFVQKVLLALFTLGMCLGFLAFFFKYNSSSRAVLLLVAPLIVIFLCIRAYLTSIYLRRLSEQENIKEAVVIVGKFTHVDSWIEEVSLEDKRFWRVAGKFDPSYDEWEKLTEMLQSNAIERVFIVTNHLEFDRITTVVEICELRGIEAWMSANFIRTQVARPTFDAIGGKPMLVFRSTPELSWQLTAKKMMDCSGAFLAILFSLPILGLIALGIKLQSAGPIFYKQKRAGLYGKEFSMWKFRTMSVNAEQQLDQLKKAQGNQMSGPVFKLENDPRVFSFGKLLRKYSLDELPQFINVLSGEMSLVGPRPMAMYELPMIEKSTHRRKLSVKPGLTCIWQVSGRNSICDFDDWVKLDLKYIDEWSLLLDIKLLLMTVPAVIFARGSK
jgi:exopolysaccharide biosynthesis polyprenyl glycosylphosphotransferase